MVNMYNVFSWQRVAANLHENECHKEKLVIYKPSTLAKKTVAGVRNAQQLMSRIANRCVKEAN